MGTDSYHPQHPQVVQGIGSNDLSPLVRPIRHRVFLNHRGSITTTLAFTQRGTNSYCSGFPNVSELTARIEKIVKNYNKSKRLLDCSATANSILERPTLLCLQDSGTGH
jgi:hypothetical protein